MKYKIFELNIDATYNISFIKFERYIFRKPKENIVEKEFSESVFSKLMVATEEEMNKLIKENCPDEDLIPRIESKFFWKNLANDNGYVVYTKIKPNIINSKVTYREIELNSRKMKYWMATLDVKDLVLILSQENLDALEIINNCNSMQ